MSIITPPSAFTSSQYSASGSQIIITSFVLKKLSIISRLAVKLLPVPAMPKIKAPRFISTFRLMAIS